MWIRSQLSIESQHTYDDILQYVRSRDTDVEYSMVQWHNHKSTMIHVKGFTKEPTWATSVNILE